MKIDITARGSGLSQDLRSYAAEKVGRLDRFFSQITSAHVILTFKERRFRKVEFVIAAAGGATLVAEQSDADPFAAIDLALGKIQRQLRKHKEKLQDLHRKRPHNS